jgi:trk system potassium uptake protein TrkA
MPHGARLASGNEVIPNELEKNQSWGTPMYIVIVGCGRYGSLLASELSGLGHSLVVIDHDESAFKGLSPQFSGYTILGNGSELAVLQQAKIDKADCVLAMCNEDTLNLMVSQIAKDVFAVPKVIARVYKPSYAPIFRKFGIEIINPIELALSAFMEALHLGTEREDQRL